MSEQPGLEPIVTGYDSPEGPAFDRQGNLFFVNWLSSSIVRVAPDGTAQEVVNTGGIPAGLAFHRDGTLYVAHFGAGRVDVLDPQGRELAPVPAPGQRPTNCAFGGPERRTLVVTEVETGGGYRIGRDVPGLPLFGER
jgi:gluconolactonase